MSKARLVGAARDGPAGCAAWPSAGLPALRWRRAVAPSYGLDAGAMVARSTGIKGLILLERL